MGSQKIKLTVPCFYKGKHAKPEFRECRGAGKGEVPGTISAVTSHVSFDH